jgi:ABC-2 type transport system ATP-binding protein
MTIILTTHYLEEAEAMCDEIAIIDRGRVLVQDETRALVARADRKTLVVTPRGDADIALPPGIELDRRDDGTLAFTWHRSRHSAEDVLEALTAASVGIRDIATVEPRLEDVFLDLTRGAHGEPSPTAA